MAKINENFMRPSQQKNRMRGRGRKQPNPLSRNYESNGPDVKIRGNASHIAEKYATLARDSAASGDRVIAENYLQHAEHYNRIIAAAAAAAGRSEDNSAGRGPQPDMSAQDGYDTEDGDVGRDADLRNPEESNGPDGTDQQDSADDAEVALEGESRNRREGGRRRRPRKADGNGTQALNGTDGAVGQQEEIGQKMTEDAARLPGNLIGSPTIPESQDGKVAQED
jgi:Domain of unknown function (DUF4167)